MLSISYELLILLAGSSFSEHLILVADPCLQLLRPERHYFCFSIQADSHFEPDFACFCMDPLVFLSSLTAAPNLASSAVVINMLFAFVSGH